MILPNQAQPLLFARAAAFTTPTFHRFTTLMAAAILTNGRRTVANLLRTLQGLASGHRTSYQRLLSAAQWSGLQRACLLTRFLLQQLLPQGVVRLVGDDTVDGHKGKKVHGKARHRGRLLVQVRPWTGALTLGVRSRLPQSSPQSLQGPLE
jgi:hypothetical protein